MGVPEEHVPNGETVPHYTAVTAGGDTIPHQTKPDSASLSSVSSNHKADEVLNEKDGKFDTDVTEQEKTKDEEGLTRVGTEDEANYPKGLKLASLITALCLGVFLVALDQTIIATAIPKITDHFHSVNDIGWYGSAYFLTSTTLQPSFGRIYKFFQIKWVFLSAVAVFELGSLICAVAPSSTALIVGRAIAVRTLFLRGKSQANLHWTGHWRRWHFLRSLDHHRLFG